MNPDEVLGPAHLNHDTFGCCPNREVLPFKCPQCGLPFAYCLECSAVYARLPDVTPTTEGQNATDSSRPSHRCQRCGYAFEHSFIRNPECRVTRAEWWAAGLGGLLYDPKIDQRPALPGEIDAVSPEGEKLRRGLSATRRWLRRAVMNLLRRPGVQVRRPPAERSDQRPDPRDLEVINRELRETSTMQLWSYRVRGQRLELVFSSEGGPRESQSYIVSFDHVLLFHLPTVLHRQAFLGIATEAESRRLVPSAGYDPEEVAGKVIYFRDIEGAALGYYVAADQVSGGWEPRRAGTI